MTVLRNAAAAVFTASMLFAQGGNGAADLEPSPMALNTTLTLRLTGRASAPWSLWLSSGTAVNPIPGVGTVWLDAASPALGELAAGAFPAGTGSTASVLSIPVPNDPNLLAFEAYLQALVVDPTAPSGVGLTRCVRIDLENQDSFTPVGSMSGSRALGSADLLPDGRVLVAGGGSGTLTSAVGSATSSHMNSPGIDFGPSLALASDPPPAPRAAIRFCTFVRSRPSRESSVRE